MVQGTMPRETDFEQDLCANIGSFSLRAAVHRGADDRPALEQRCPFISRPALDNERGAMKCHRASGSEAEDALTRRRDAPGIAAAGAHLVGR